MNQEKTIFNGCGFMMSLMHKSMRSASLQKLGLLFAMICFVAIFTPTELSANNADKPEVIQQNKLLKGKVVDKGGFSIPGATVQIKGAGGALCDADGAFELRDCPVGATLIVTCIGYSDNEVVYKGGNTIEIVLADPVEQLEELTFVAFATQKKESVVASITTIKPDELRVPSSNFTTALAGRVAGLTSYQISGEPGKDNANFFIRGITTFGADAKKDPLILIDGIELGVSDLARLNSDDIASFSIMKDATATALYGARGANGVIYVTTKEGKEGKLSVNLRLETSFSSPTEMVDLADPVTYMKMENESIKTRDPLGLSMYSTEKIRMTERGLYSDIFPSTDWYDVMFKNVTSNQRANLSLSGGGKVARYYVAAAITNDNGNLKIDKRNNFNSNINLKKYSLRSNVNINLTKTTELIFRLSSAFDEYVGPMDGGSHMYNLVMSSNPVLFKPYYEPTEEFSHVNHIMFGNYDDAQYINPYAESLKGYKDYSTNTTLVQFEGKQDLEMLTKGLNLRAKINLERYSEFSVTRQYKPYYYGISSYNLVDNTYALSLLNEGKAEEWIDYNLGGSYINTSIYVEGALEYSRTFDKHYVNGLLVYTMQNSKNGLASSLQTSLPSRNMGLAGRAAYNYDNRYFAEFTFGYNGSERFSENNRWGFFPSASAGWLVSNEKFFEPLKSAIKTLKLKGSYGMIGQDQIGSANDRFFYLSQVNMGFNAPVNWGTYLDYNPGGVYVDRYANDRIGWEIAYKSNIGLEIETAGGFNANVEYFTENRENILLSRSIPSTMGIKPELKANLGKAKGSGVDAEVNYEKTFGNGDLWLVGTGTFTYATSEVVEWEEPDYSATPWLSRVGHSLGQNWGYIAERLFVDEEDIKNSPTQFGEYMPGDIKYRDVNGDGKISTLDKVPIGLPATPEINFGFGLSGGYKGFDASFFFQGTGRQSFWIDYNAITPFAKNSSTGGNNVVMQTIADNYWSENNRNPYAFYPRLSHTTNENNQQFSTWYMQNGSFLRLKSVEVGYTFPEKLTNKINIDNLRLYVSGTNLLTWSAFKLWDPEMAGNGLGYPIQRVINVGLNVQF